MVLLLWPELNLIADRLDFPSLPLSPVDQIADDETLEGRNQRHRQNEKNAGDHRDIEKEHGLRTYLARLGCKQHVCRNLL